MQVNKHNFIFNLVLQMIMKILKVIFDNSVDAILLISKGYLLIQVKIRSLMLLKQKDSYLALTLGYLLILLQNNEY